MESRFGQLLVQHCVPFKYEKTKLKYKVPEEEHTYTPDWDIKGTIVETKGRFTTSDRKKMRLVRQDNPNKRIIILFERSNRKIYKGSNTTYADWCDKNNIEWRDWKQAHELIKELK